MRSREEARIQTAIVNWARRNLDCIIAHVPNGGSRNRLEAINLKNQGVLAGHPDLVIYSHGFVGLMEVKEPTGALTDSQKEMFPEIERLGIPLAVVRSLEQAKTAFAEWNIPPRQLRPVPRLVAHGCF